jgi:hypothetical protein
VGNHQNRKSLPFMQIAQQFEYLGLNSHIKGGDRLVADKNVRFKNQRPGDCDTLALAGTQLRGPPLLRVPVQPYQLKVMTRSFQLFVTAALIKVAQRLHDKAQRRVARVKARPCVLKNNLDMAAQAAPCAAGQRGNVRPPVHDPAAVRFFQSHDASCQS